MPLNNFRSSPKGKASPFPHNSKSNPVIQLARDMLWEMWRKHCMTHLNPMSPTMNKIIINHATRRKL